MPCRIPLALGALVLAAGVGPAAAGPDELARVAPDAPPVADFALTYDVYSGGFRAMRLDFAVDFATAGDPEGYETRINMETSGIIGAMFKWRFDAESAGLWREGEIEPARYRTANVWRGNERTVAIEYEDGVAAQVRAEPPYSEEDMKKVAPEMIPGAVDPTSAVTALVLTSAVEGTCRANTPIYDGRRRYDANMVPLESRTLKPSSAAPFEGEAEGCRLTFERIAGFRPDRKRAQDLAVDVWLADIGVETGRVPVRLELQTPWGAGFAHLVRAENGADGLVFGEPDDD